MPMDVGPPVRLGVGCKLWGITVVDNSSAK